MNSFFFSKESISFCCTVFLIAACGLQAGPEPAPEKNVGGAAAWKSDFKIDPGTGKNEADLPKTWELKTKPGTAAAKFNVVFDKAEARSFMHMEADKASASVICEPKKIDPKKTPVVRWCWRVGKLPDGGDGRNSDKDDQAIGIYIGTGSMFSKKSVSYRWDTDTPKGSEGNCSYGMGTIGIKWFTLRNKEDAAAGKSGWFIEERNYADDFKKAWGYCPESIYISISCNSQYTGTKASADLEWIELRESTTVKNSSE